MAAGIKPALLLVCQNCENGQLSTADPHVVVSSSSGPQVNAEHHNRAHQHLQHLSDPLKMCVCVCGRPRPVKVNDCFPAGDFPPVCGYRFASGGPGFFAPLVFLFFFVGLGSRQGSFCSCTGWPWMHRSHLANNFNTSSSSRPRTNGTWQFPLWQQLPVCVCVCVVRGPMPAISSLVKTIPIFSKSFYLWFCNIFVLCLKR